MARAVIGAYEEVLCRGVRVRSRRRTEYSLEVVRTPLSTWADF